MRDWGFESDRKLENNSWGSKIQRCHVVSRGNHVAHMGGRGLMRIEFLILELNLATELKFSDGVIPISKK